MEQTLQEQVEHCLGVNITPSEWDQAKAYAVHKLAVIIEREGDGNGVRRESWYLAQLITETVRLNALSMKFQQQTDWQQAKKDGSRKSAEPSHNQAYCNTVGTEMQ